MRLQCSQGRTPLLRASPLTSLPPSLLFSLSPPSQSTMFSDEDLQGMFSLFDPVSNNFITADQARTALRNLGIKDLSCVPEAGGTRFDSKAFVALARGALERERLV